MHRWNLRKVISLAHLWVGLAFCVPFALLGITGSVLVFEQQIDTMMSPPPHARSDAAVRSPESVIEAAKAARPDLQPLSLVMPAAPGDAAVVNLGQPGRGGRGGRAFRQVAWQAFVDPGSANVLEVKRPFRSDVIGVVHRLHSNLLLGAADGRAVVGWLGVGMAMLAISGIVMWWPRPGRWKYAYGIRRNARGWLFHRELHGTVGITVSLLLFLVSITGVAISFPEFSRELANSFSSAEAESGPATTLSFSGPKYDSHDGDAAAALASAAMPGARLSTMFIPARSDQPYRVEMVPAGYGNGAPAATLTVDTKKGEVTISRDPYQGTLGARLLVWQRPLHAGRGFGMLYRSLIFVSGIVPALFAVTGVAMWWIKRRSKKRAAAGIRVADGQLGVRPAGSGAAAAEA